MFVTPRRGDYSLSADLTSDETPATGSHQRFTQADAAFLNSSVSSFSFVLLTEYGYMIRDQEKEIQDQKSGITGHIFPK